jgi:hypothetical protein
MKIIKTIFMCLATIFYYAECKNLYLEDQPQMLVDFAHVDLSYPTVWEAGVGSLIFKVHRTPIYIGSEIVNGFYDGPLIRTSILPLIVRFIIFDNFKNANAYIPIYITTKTNAWLNYYIRPEDKKFLNFGQFYSVGLGTEILGAPLYIAEFIKPSIELGYFYQAKSSFWKWLSDKPAKGFYIKLSICYSPDI